MKYLPSEFIHIVIVIIQKDILPALMECCRVMVDFNDQRIGSGMVNVNRSVAIKPEVHLLCVVPKEFKSIGKTSGIKVPGPNLLL